MKKIFLLAGIVFLLCNTNSVGRFWQDLMTEAPHATWLNDKGNRLPFPGKPNDPRGFARILTAQLEDGKPYSYVLQTHPRWEANGWIEVRYPLSVPENCFFESHVGFIEGASNSDGVVFEVLWAEAGNDVLLKSLPKRYSRQLSLFKADLNPYAGHSGYLVLRVKAGLSSSQDWAVWCNPQIGSGRPQRAFLVKKRPTKRILASRPSQKRNQTNPIRQQPQSRRSIPIKTAFSMTKKPIFCKNSALISDFRVMMARMSPIFPLMPGG
jgi:hypothetical protein